MKRLFLERSRSDAVIEDGIIIGVFCCEADDDALGRVGLCCDDVPRR